MASACPSRQPQSSRHEPELFPMGSKSHQTPVTGYRHGCFLEVRARLPHIHATSLEPRCGVFSVILLTDLNQFVANFPQELVSRETEPCLCPLECHLSWPDKAHASGLLVMGDASWQIGWRLLETQTRPVKHLPTQFSPRAAGARIGGIGDFGGTCFSFPRGPGTSLVFYASGCHFLNTTSLTGGPKTQLIRVPGTQYRERSLPGSYPFCEAPLPIFFLGVGSALTLLAICP